MIGRRTLQPLDAAALASAGLVSVLTAMAVVQIPLLVLLAGIACLLMSLALGPESLIAVGLLGASGFFPFVDPDTFVVGQIKGYAFFFGFSLGLMALTWLFREIADRRSWPLPRNGVSLGLVALLAYVALVAVASRPAEVPALAVPFAILPLAGLGTILWLSHEKALAGLRRALPVAISIVVAWAVAYIAGSAGCVTCQDWVGAYLIKDGLLGEGSRLYTAGQNSFLALFLIAFAYMLHRPNRLSIPLVGLGALAIALQSSRAQYMAVLAGVGLLIVWKMGQLRVGRRLALALVTGLALVSLLNSPVGDRAITAYTEVQQGSGNAGYRLDILAETAENWTVFGQGFSANTLDLGYDIDLGLPNTLLVLGYIGAIIQLILIGAGIWRGVVARNLVGVTIAAILLMVLVARPTLPLLEYGFSATLYGAVLGFAAWLSTRRLQSQG